MKADPNIIITDILKSIMNLEVLGVLISWYNLLKSAPFAAIRAILLSRYSATEAINYV